MTASPDAEPARRGQSGDQDARRRIMAARVLAQKRWPYVSAMLFGLRFVEVDPQQLATMAVDRGWRLYYSPDFVLSCGPEALATVLLHECQHLMLDHARRFEALKQPPERHHTWNLAADAVINAQLDQEDMPWPDERGIRYGDLEHLGVEPGMAAEPAYFAMVRSGTDEGSDEESEPASGEGADPGSPSDQGAGWGERPPSSPEGSDSDPPGDSGEGTRETQESVLRGGCGAAAGGEPGEYELPTGDDEAPAVGPAQCDLVRDRVAQDIRARQRSHGDVPQGLARWAEEQLNPVVDWRKVLAGLIRSALASASGRRDFSYQFPSRRAEGLRRSLGGAILPAMRQPPPPSVAAVVDTSGSISDLELKQFLSEVVNIVRSVGVREGVTVIPCDSRAYDSFRIRRQADIRNASFPGRGGTDMRVGLEAAIQLRPRPDVVVVFTDGYTPWPAGPPHPATVFIVAIPESSRVVQDAGGAPTWSRALTVSDGEHAADWTRP